MEVYPPVDSIQQISTFIPNGSDFQLRGFSLLSMIKQINALQYSILKQINLENVNIKYSSDSFDKFSMQYKENGWRLEKSKKYNTIYVNRLYVKWAGF